MRDSKPEPCLGEVFWPLRNAPARPSFKPESNKHLVLPILQSATAKEEILGLLPFSTEPGALDGVSLETNSPETYGTQRLGGFLKSGMQTKNRATRGRKEQPVCPETIAGSKRRSHQERMPGRGERPRNLEYVVGSYHRAADSSNASETTYGIICILLCRSEIRSNHRDRD